MTRSTPQVDPADPAGSAGPDNGDPSGRGEAALFSAASDKLPPSLPVRLLRWWIPAGLCLLGIVLLVVDDFDTFGVSAFAAFVGAGSSTWLINFLWRLGVSGDDERDREAKDREYLALHGHWPDEEHSSAQAESADRLRSS